MGELAGERIGYVRPADIDAYFRDEVVPRSGVLSSSQTKSAGRALPACRSLLIRLVQG